MIATIPFATVVRLNLDQDTVELSQQGGALDTLQVNSLPIAVTDSEWGWGNRYELGYIVDHHGWMVSVLGGLKQHYDAVYGGGHSAAARVAGRPGPEWCGRDPLDSVLGVTDPDAPLDSAGHRSGRPVPGALYIPRSRATNRYRSSSRTPWDCWTGLSIWRCRCGPTDRGRHPGRLEL